MRKDGKFVGADGTIPEGQAIVIAHLNECHELVEEVQSMQLSYNDLRKLTQTQLKETMDDPEAEEEEEYDEEYDDGDPEEESS